MRLMRNLVNKMKVAFVSSDNYRGSGAFRSMVKLIELLRDNYDVQVKVVLPYHGNGEELLQAANIDYIYIPSYNWVIELNNYNSLKKRLNWQIKKLRNRNAIKRLEKFFCDFQPDIVHINTSYSYVGAVAANRLNIPVVWHIREFLEEDQQTRYWDRKYAYSLYKKASCVVAISQAIYNKYVPKIGGDNLQVIYNGIDEANFYSKHELFKSGNQLITVGGLNKGKGHATILKSLGILKKRGFNDFHYLIVGEGGEKESLINLASSEGIDKEVEFYGLSKDPSKLYQKSDIYLMGSLAEAFGRVTVEAMMSGLLVIGRDSAGTSEILQNGKYGVLFKNEEELANVLEDVFKNQDRYKLLAQNGQKHALDVYTAKRNADNIYHTYQRIMSHH